MNRFSSLLVLSLLAPALALADDPRLKTQDPTVADVIVQLRVTTEVTFGDMAGNTFAGILTRTGDAWTFTGEYFPPQAAAGTSVELSGVYTQDERVSEKSLAVWGEEKYAIALPEEGEEGSFRVYLSDGTSVPLTIGTRTPEALMAATGVVYEGFAHAVQCSTTLQECLAAAQNLCGNTNGVTNVKKVTHTCDPTTGASTCSIESKDGSGTTPGGGNP